MNAIYKIRNLVNGKFYVGSSVNTRVRFQNHRRHLRRGTHHCRPLQNAWDRYNDGKPRKFEIQIAAPANLAAVEGNVGALTDAGRKLAEMSKAPMIRIEISMGGKRAGFLDKDFVTSALKYFTSGEGRNDDVRSLKATVKDGEESGIDPIDFLDEKLYIKDDLSFPENDADQHYKVRENFLRTCFTSHFDYITSVYGKGAD